MFNTAKTQVSPSRWSGSTQLLWHQQSSATLKKLVYMFVHNKGIKSRFCGVMRVWKLAALVSSKAYSRLDVNDGMNEES